MHICELAPVIVVMETVPKHKIQFYYWGSIVPQMNFNEIAAEKKKKNFMEASELFSKVCQLESDYIIP